MDHSYSKERTKVQKIDHSYFTVGKKTPAVVLRKAQLQKQDQCQTRPGVDQDHSYTRPDLSDALVLEIYHESERGEDSQTVNSVNPCTPMYTKSRAEDSAPPEQEEPPSNVPTPTKTRSASQAWRSRPIIVQPDYISQCDAPYENESFDYDMENDYSSHETQPLDNDSKERLENSVSSNDSNVIVHSSITYDLDGIDRLISDINLDHAYEVRSIVRPRRRVHRINASCANDSSSQQSEEEQQPMDDDSVGQGDHTYLDLHTLNETRSDERVMESTSLRHSFRFDDHTYLQTGRTKGASTQSIERVHRTDHTYLQSDEYPGMTSIRKAKSETNLTISEQPHQFEGSSWCQRSDDHTYLNSDAGQRMSDDAVDNPGSDDSQGTADCVDTRSFNDDKEIGAYQFRRPYRHSFTGLADHSYEVDIY